MEVMHHLISSAKDTLWGKDHNFGNIDGYQDFASFMSVNSYEELKSYIHQMREGKPDILWPGGVVRQVIRHHQRQEQVHSRKQRRTEGDSL